MKNFLHNIFSIKKRDNHKVITILGIKLKFKNYNPILSDLRNEINILRSEQNMYNNALKNIQTHLLDNLIKKRATNGICNYTDFIKDLFENQTVRLAAWKFDYNDILKYYNILFNKSTYVQDNINNSTINIFWGSQFFVNDNVELLADCLISNKRYVFAEMGFLHRISYPSQNYKYSNGISFMFDDLAPYYDARYKNRLENMLNDITVQATKEGIA